jgi:hypothetical protein
MTLKFVFGIISYALFGFSTSFALNAQAATEATPRICSSRKSPTKGAPTVAQAEMYFICDGEFNINGGLGAAKSKLVRDVKIEISPKPIFINRANIEDIKEAAAGRNMDVEKPAYAIRGSFVNYACTKNSSGCIVDDIQSTGFCFVDNFSDWHCIMKGKSSSTRRNVPWPTN